MEDRPTEEQTDLKDVPVSALRFKSREMLACMLNNRKVITTSEGFPRDYRGIADCMGIVINNCWVHENNYMNAILDRSHNSVHDLLLFLRRVDRFDVVEDCYDSFLEDAERFHQRKNQLVPALPIKDDLGLLNDAATFKVTFDAFLLYVDEDRSFAQTVLTKLESLPFNLTLCDQDRDIKAGVRFVHHKIKKIIENRCNKLLVIMSNDFFKSNEHLFLLEFADHLNFTHQSNKIIPIKYKDCDVPQEYQYIFALDFRRTTLTNSDNWQKLSKSVKCIQSVPAKDNHTLHQILPREVNALPVSSADESRSSSSFVQQEVAANKVDGPVLIVAPDSGTQRDEKREHSAHFVSSVRKTVSKILLRKKSKKGKPNKLEVACPV